MSENTMTDDPAAGAGMTLWRAWLARLAMQRAILMGQFTGTETRRATAQKRAAAAEMIAQQANAARMKVLLEAAREQAAVKPIQSAERRFAEAKGVWEAAQQVLPAVEPDVVGEETVPAPPPAIPASPTVGLLRNPRRIPLLAACVAALIATGVYLFMDTKPAEEAPLAAAAPAAAEIVTAAPMPASAVAEPGPEAAPPAAAGPAVTAAAEPARIPEAAPVVRRRRVETRAETVPTPGPNPFRIDATVSENVAPPPPPPALGIGAE